MTLPSTAVLPLNPMALRLGYLGLVPFVVCTLLAWLIGGSNVQAHAFVMQAFSAYASCVIALLGGVHWGLAFRQASPSPQPFVWGAAASGLAWLAMVMPAYAGLVIHGILLIVCYLVDRRCYPEYGVAAWLTMRFRLSAGAALCCFLGAAST